jgi:hypothetical protein
MVRNDTESVHQSAMVADDAHSSSVDVGFCTVESTSNEHQTKVISCASVQSCSDTIDIHAILVAVDVGQLWTIHDGVETFHIRAVKIFKLQ